MVTAPLAFCLSAPVFSDCNVSLYLTRPEKERSTEQDDIDKTTAEITILVRGMLKSRSGAT